MDASKNSLRSAPVHYQEMADRIIKLSGIKYSLVVYETDDTKTWLTQHTNGVPIMAYNPKFIEMANTAGKWVSAVIFANEVACHHNMDFNARYLSSYYNLKFAKNESRKKLEVNYFTGKVLRHEGATLEESLETISIFTGSKSEEVRRDLEEIMISGWKAENERLNKLEAVEKPKQKPGDNNISGSQIAALLLGLFITLLKD